MSGGSLDGLGGGINDNLGVEGSAIVEEAGFGLLVELLFVDLVCGQCHNL